MTKSKKAHHGGAWKVAYADFVTAMMALFLVLWLTAQDERIKEAVERAFKNPFTSLTKDSVGIVPSDQNLAVKSQSGNFDSASAVELTMLRRLNQDLLKSLQQHSEELNQTIKLDLTPEGLRISIFDRAHKPIFKPDSTETTPYGTWVFSTLAWEIARYSNFIIEVEGHTELNRTPVKPNYGNWELSADRANAARRKLLIHGVKAGQIRKVAGFADTRPLPNLPPDAEANRRVAVLMKVNESGGRNSG